MTIFPIFHDFKFTFFNDTSRVAILIIAFLSTGAISTRHTKRSEKHIQNQIIKLNTLYWMVNLHSCEFTIYWGIKVASNRTCFPIHLNLHWKRGLDFPVDEFPYPPDSIFGLSAVDQKVRRYGIGRLVILLKNSVAICVHNLEYPNTTCENFIFNKDKWKLQNQLKLKDVHRMFLINILSLCMILQCYQLPLCTCTYVVT